MKKNELREKETVVVSRIQWETDGADVDLPSEVELPECVDASDDDAIADYLSDTYGFLVLSYSVPMTDNDIDEFGLYVNNVEASVS
jgi:hypothetical protein